jgi:hypothetical protein
MKCAGLITRLEGKGSVTRFHKNVCCFILLAMVQVFSGSAHSQGTKLAFAKFDSGSISGIVRDGDGKGVAGATVTLTSHSASSATFHATSSPTGEYRFGGLSDAEYALNAELAGYSTGGGRVIQISQGASVTSADITIIRGSVKGAEPGAKSTAHHARF